MRVLSHARTLAEALALLENEPFDVVLLDLMLSDSRGLETLDAVRGAAGEAAIVVLSSLQDEEVALATLGRGAQDYLFKSELDPTRIRRALRYAVERAELRRARALLDAERARAVAELEREQRYRELFEQSRDGIFITSSDGTVVDINEALLALTGYTREEFLRLNAVDAYADPADRDRFRAAVQEHGAVRDFEVKIRRKDGSVFDAIYSAGLRRDEQGRILGYQGVVQDVTERLEARRRSEAAAAEARLSLARLEAVLDALPVGVFITDAQGEVQMTNAAASEIRGGHAPLVGVEPYREYPAWRADTGAPLAPEDWPIARAVRTGEPATTCRSRCARSRRSATACAAATPTRWARRGRTTCRRAWRRRAGAWRSASCRPSRPIRSRCGLSALGAGAYDVVLLDYRLGEGTGLDFLGRLPLEDGTPPVILLTGQGDRATDLMAMQAGAADYLAKRGLNATMLERSIRYAVERHRARVAKHEAEQRYQLLLQSVGAIVWQGDPETLRFTFVSREAEHLLGYPAERWTEEPEFWPDHIHPEDRSWALAYCEDASRRGLAHTFEYRMIASDGRVVWLRDIVRVVEIAGRRTLAGVMVDITAAREAEETIRLRDRAVEAISEGIVLTDAQQPDYPIVYVNPAFQELTGYPTGEIPGSNCRFAPMWEDGAIRGVHGIARDITDERERERHVRRVERLAGVGTLIAGVAHELYNPLSAVLGFTRLLLMDRRPESEREDLETIARETERMAKIVSDLRLIARDTQEDTGRRQRVDLNDVVRHILRTRDYSLRTRNIEVREELRDGLPPLLADRGQLEQVLLNLVVNAEQAMDGAPGARTLTVRTRRAPGGASVQVVDSGRGISKAHLERIFDPFFTTKAPGEGTGLGLSLVHSIVREHKGDIRVDSEPGKGTAIRIDLPKAPPENEMEMEATPLTRAARPLRVLVVDDEDAVRRVVVRTLQRRGHRVDEAAEGNRALQMLDAAPYDVIVSDLRMPGMSGDELLSRLRQRSGGIEQRLIFLTGDTASPEAVRILAGAEVPILAKPAAIADVVRWVEQVGAEA